MQQKENEKIELKKKIDLLEIEIEKLKRINKSYHQRNGQLEKEKAKAEREHGEMQKQYLRLKEREKDSRLHKEKQKKEQLEKEIKKLTKKVDSLNEFYWARIESMKDFRRNLFRLVKKNRNKIRLSGPLIAGTSEKKTASPRTRLWTRG